MRSLSVNHSIFSILRVPAFWRFQLTFWALVVLSQILLVGLTKGDSTTFLNPGLIMVRLMTGLILSTVAAVILGWLDSLQLSTVKFTMATGVLILSLFTIGSLAGYRVFLQINHAPPPKEILLTFLLLRIGIYTLWTVLFLRFIAQTRRERLLRENNLSKLALLRSQVNPHFLFNSLNAIVAEADQPERVREITSSLSEYLRFSVKQGDEGAADLRPLREELTALEDYLRIHHIRFEEKLVSTIDVEEEARCQQVPQALIQPLLENAINYGLKTSPLPLVIRISGRLLGPVIQIVVENSGHWIEPMTHGGKLQSESTGTGLRNLCRRLELIYGSKALLEIEKETALVRICVTLPVSAHLPENQ